ncbi:hypothetical protein CR513_02094, partial [Mucuna pruriens]
MSPYRIVFDKACHLPSTDLTRRSRSAIWPMTKPAESGNYTYRSYKSYAWKLIRTLGSTRKRILRKVLKVEQKVLLFHSRLKLIASKYCSRWDRSFVVTNIFPYANNRTFKVNGHQLKPYHEGLNLSLNWGEVEIVELIKPIIPEK